MDKMGHEGGLYRYDPVKGSFSDKSAWRYCKKPKDAYGLAEFRGIIWRGGPTEPYDIKTFKYKSLRDFDNALFKWDKIIKENNLM